MHERKLYGKKVKTIDEFFDAVDRDGGGSVDREELGGALKRLGLGLKKEHIDILMEVFDEDGGGEIERDEFREKLEWAGWGKKQKLPWQMRARQSEYAQTQSQAGEASVGAQALALRVMETADMNQSGALTFTELTTHLCSTAYDSFGSWINEQRQAVFWELDADIEGTIDLVELIVAVNIYLETPVGEAFAETHPDLLSMEGAPSRDKLEKGRRIEGLIREAANVEQITQTGASLNLRKRKEDQYRIAIDNLYHSRALDRIKRQPQDANPKKQFLQEQRRRKKRDQLSERKRQMLGIKGGWAPDLSGVSGVVPTLPHIPHPPQQSKKRGVGRGAATARGVVRAYAAPKGGPRNTGASTARPVSPYSAAYRGDNPAHVVLSKVFPEDLTSLLCTRGPPSEVKRVAMAVMILVTPEDFGTGGVHVNGGELDKWWRRLIEWVNDLGGAHKWLVNLWNFKMSMVTIVNTVRSYEVLDVGSLEAGNDFQHKLSIFHPVMGHLCRWVKIVCRSYDSKATEIQINDALPPIQKELTQKEKAKEKATKTWKQMQRQQDEKHKKKTKIDILAMLKPQAQTLTLPTGEVVTVSSIALAKAKERAATQIQNAHRAKVARHDARERKEHSEAAIMIQQAQRRKKARQAVIDKREEFTAKAAAATKIQNARRAKVAREAVSTKKQQQEAAIKIQTVHRGKAAQTAVTDKRTQKDAATKIQQAHRAKAARGVVSTKKEDQKKSEAAAKKAETKAAARQKAKEQQKERKAVKEQIDERPTTTTTEDWGEDENFKEDPCTKFKFERERFQRAKNSMLIDDLMRKGNISGITEPISALSEEEQWPPALVSEEFQYSPSLSPSRSPVRTAESVLGQNVKTPLMLPTGASSRSSATDGLLHPEIVEEVLEQAETEEPASLAGEGSVAEEAGASTQVHAPVPTAHAEEVDEESVCRAMAPLECVAKEVKAEDGLVAKEASAAAAKREEAVSEEQHGRDSSIIDEKEGPLPAGGVGVSDSVSEEVGEEPRDDIGEAPVEYAEDFEPPPAELP